jgi:hypothetical protein
VSQRKVHLTYTALVLHEKVDSRWSTFGKLMHDLCEIDYVEEVAPGIIIDQLYFFAIDLGGRPSWP